MKISRKRFSGKSRSQNLTSKYYKDRNERLLSGELKPSRIADIMVLNPEIVQEVMKRLI